MLVKLHSLDLQPARVQVRLNWLDKLGTVHNLVANVQGNKEDQADVRHEEVRSVPGNEGGEALGQNDEAIPEESVPREEGLPKRLEW